MYSKTQKKSNHTTLLVTSSWSRIPLRNSLEFGCHLPGAMCMEVWGAGVGGGGQGLVVACAGWGGEHRGRWGGGSAGPWSVQAGGKMNNSPPRTDIPTYRVEGGMGEVIKQIQQRWDEGWESDGIRQKHTHQEIKIQHCVAIMQVWDLF